MERIAFFDTKPYEREWFERLNTGYDIRFYEGRLRPESARLAEGCKAVCAFVNDDVGEETVNKLAGVGVEIIAMRCAGFNNVSLSAAKGRIKVVRVPAYSPYAVAEHAMGLILALNRKIPRAYIRTRDFNFSLNGLTGFDLHGKTAGVVGTGKIGRVFIDICRGFGMNVIAHDPYPAEGSGIEYVSRKELFSRSDIISLHCPLNEGTRYIINDEALTLMKPTALIVNTSRGMLIDSAALLRALNEKRIGGAALDVYEEETDLFFEDNSDRIVTDETLSVLVNRPNVIITSHQAFLTEEALRGIAEVTLANLEDYFGGRELKNEIRA
ncbi:MAG: 2-hydroxyacid dehydrogenase [Oscillospiraceae bacterium]